MLRKLIKSTSGFRPDRQFSVTTINVANRRVQLDNSLTFGFHWDNPREIYLELRYRFHY
jgi:hypothetical protein